MKDTNFDKGMDWEGLAEKIKNSGIRNKTIVAVMPQHPPMRLLSGFTEGIHPTKEYFHILKESD